MSKKKRQQRDDNREAAVALAAEASGPPPSGTGAATASISREDYEAQLHLLQVELVKLQRHFIGCGDKILVLVEGGDAAGKDGAIKRVVEYLSPRETRVVALGKPPTENDAAGISSAISPSSRSPKSSFFSIAVGTTAPASSM